MSKGKEEILRIKKEHVETVYRKSTMLHKRAEMLLTLLGLPQSIENLYEVITALQRERNISDYLSGSDFDGLSQRDLRMMNAAPLLYESLRKICACVDGQPTDNDLAMAETALDAVEREEA